ncbi:MAG: PAS domain S-box protein [Planctomycetota bacterium]
MNPDPHTFPDTAQENLRRYRLMVDHAPFCVHEIALDGTFQSINPTGCKLIGFEDPEDVRGVPFAEVVAEQSLEEAYEVFGRALQGETVQFQCMLKNPAGEVLTDSHLYPLRDEEGAIVGLFGLSIDITDGQAALEKLRGSEARYRQMFETNLAVKFILCPKTGLIQQANAAACDFYGYSKEEFQSMNIMDINILAHEEIRAEMAAATREERLSFEFQHRLKDGQVRDVEVFSGPIDTPDGVRLYSIVHDITDRKNAERELAVSQERFALAVSGSNDGVWDNDLVRGEVYWSDRCKALLGFGPDEIDPNLNDRFEFIHPDDRELVHHAFFRHLFHREPYDLEIRMRNSSGQHRWFRTRGQAIWNRDGEPIRMTGSIRDIQERKEVADRLRESEDRFTAALAGTQEGIWDWDILADSQWWSPRFKELLGYGTQEIEGSRAFLYEIMHESDRDQTYEAVRLHLVEGKRYDARFRLKTAAGEYRWFRSRGQAILDDRGRAVRASGSLADVHEEVLAEVAREERQHRQQRQQQCILELATDPGLARMPLRQACARITELGCEVMDICRCSVLLRHPGETGLRSVDLYVAEKDEHFEGVVLKDTELPKFFEELEKSRIIVSEDPITDPRFDEFPREYILKRKVRSIMEVPIRRGGKLIGLIGISETRRARQWEDDEIAFSLDLAQQCARLLEQVDAQKTEEKQRELERQMLQAQKMESLGLMAGGVAHDFNNLLVAILGNADLLKEMVPKGSRQQGLVGEIGAASQRAAELCQQMLAFSGHGRLSRDRFCLEEVVSEMSHLLRVTVSKDAELEFLPSGQLPKMEGDATQVRQVIMNLILNASESLSGGSGRIQVRTDVGYREEQSVEIGLPIPKAGDYLSIEVRDTGEGMHVETLERLFDPFFSTKFTGRGLGLAAVLGIVKAHGGGIEVESSVGVGTCFRLSFPVAPETAEAEIPVTKAPKDWRGSGAVLLVDDDETVLQLGREMLERLGFVVEIATDGEQAIASFRRLHASLRFVLLDLTMPGLSGEEVYAALQDHDGSVPIIMSSGYTEQDVTQRLGPRGLRGFLQKPYTLVQLRTQIESVLGDQLQN